MIDTRLCSSEQDVKDAMHYESLVAEKKRIETKIFKLDYELKRLDILKENEKERLDKCNDELNLLSNKPWIVYSAKGNDHG